MHIHVFESPKKRHVLLIWLLSKLGREVFVIEPFYAYHHEHGVRFNPCDIPVSVQKLIEKGLVKLLPSKNLGARENYIKASNLAVKTCEKVFPSFQATHQSWVHYLSRVLKSNDADLIFKKMLCDQLAVFYSTNLMLGHIRRQFDSKITMYAEMNPFLYEYLKTLLNQNGIPVSDDSNVGFSISSKMLAFFSSLMQLRFRLFALLSIVILYPARLILQLGRFPKKRKFRYAINLNSPKRQITGEKNLRGVDFFIDEEKIKKEECVLIPSVSLNAEQRKEIESGGLEVVYPMSKTKSIIRLSSYVLPLAFLKLSPISLQLTITALFSLIEYIKWQDLLKRIEIKNYITHGDFAYPHIARSLVLKENNVITWYFQDAVNTTLNFYDLNSDDEGLHPFWSYLSYDHYLMWTKMHADFFKRHPGPLKDTQVVGCLWADHIYQSNRLSAKKDFVILAFDSTYTRNSFTSYEEGMAYAAQLIRLADDIPNLKILFKEKRQRAMHAQVDCVLGPELLKIYDKLSNHPRISVALNTKDHAEMVMNADLIVSFPFTSTTFEALAAKRPAIWHDPMGFYSETLYGQIPDVVTKGYEELKSKVLDVMHDSGEHILKAISQMPELFDSFKDGKATGRFREKLTGSHIEEHKPLAGVL